MAKKQKINNMLEDLGEIVKSFESGKVDVEEGINKYKKAAQLIKKIKRELSSVELQVEEIKESY